MKKQKLVETAYGWRTETRLERIEHALWWGVYVSVLVLITLMIIN